MSVVTEAHEFSAAAVSAKQPSRPLFRPHASRHTVLIVLQVSEERQ